MWQVHDPVDEALPAGGGLANHRRHLKDFPGVLDVVTAVANPARYRARYDLYRAFARHVADAGARLTTVECAFGDRPFEVTEAGDPRHLQVRTRHEVWAKECLLNLGFQRLPRDWRYVAWVDADVLFQRPDWAQETLQQLQHHPVVQMWSHAVDLGPDYEPFGTARSFASCYRAAASPAAASRLARARGYAGEARPGAGGYWHSGYAWAARREAVDALGGLLDFAALGSADFYMAWAFIGELAGHLYQDVADPTRADRGFHPNYVRRLLDWQDRAAWLRKDVGVVPGAVTHAWHGRKRSRQYNTRENILIDHQFDPDRDLMRDWQGVWQLRDDGSPRAVGLRDGIRGYFRTRDEDGSEL